MTPEYDFHSGTSSSQFPLVSLYFDYSRISHNNVSHTRVSLAQQWHQIKIFILVQKPIPVSRKHGITV